jgi:hypothetical protein
MVGQYSINLKFTLQAFQTCKAFTLFSVKALRLFALLPKINDTHIKH